MQQWSEDAPTSATPASPAGFCDGCGTALAAGTRFCTSCGRPREGFCSWCHAPLPEGVQFCPSCGRPAVRDRVYGRRAVAGKPIAGFAFRAGVYFVDGLITGIPTQVIQLRLDALFDWKGRREDAGTAFGEGRFGDGVELWGPELAFLGVTFVVGLVLTYVWNSIGWSPAMRAIGLRIVDAGGHPPGWRRGLKRTAASWLSALALGLGYVAAALHPEKRTWHDRMAGTWVVDVREQH